MSGDIEGTSNISVYEEHLEFGVKTRRIAYVADHEKFDEIQGRDLWFKVENLSAVPADLADDPRFRKQMAEIRYVILEPTAGFAELK